MLLEAPVVNEELKILKLARCCHMLLKIRRSLWLAFLLTVPIAIFCLFHFLKGTDCAINFATDNGISFIHSLTHLSILQQKCKAEKRSH